VDDPVGGNCPDRQARDQRQKPQARDDGISAENALEVLRHGEQHADHGEDRHRREQHAPGERGGAEQREVDQRLTAGPGAESAFPAEESDQQRHSADHHEHGAGIAPAVLACLDQAVGHGHEPTSGGRDPDEIQARALRRA
jgi:hypothetical protein